MTLAAGGGVIILTVLGFTVAALLHPGAMSSTMRLAARCGFVTLLAALVVGALMIASGVVEARTGNPQVAYTTAGKLKPVHAVAMHGILVLPGLAWLLGFTGMPVRQQARLVWTAVVAYATSTVVVGIESFKGVSVFAAPPIALATSVAAVAVLTITAAAAVSGVIRTDSNVDRLP